MAPALVLALLGIVALLASRPSTAAARIRAVRAATGPSRRRRIRFGGGISPLVAALVGSFAFGATAHLGFGFRLPVLPAVAGLLVGWTVGRLLTGFAAERDRRRHDTALVEAVGALAADLRAGQHLAAALAAQPDLPSEAVRAVRTVCQRSGAPAAAVLDRVEQDLRARDRQRREVAAQLAGARATAVLLSALPLLGIGLGAAMGADPVPVLFGTGRGQVALLVGVGLDVLGLLWTARIVARAEALS